MPYLSIGGTRQSESFIIDYSQRGTSMCDISNRSMKLNCSDDHKKKHDIVMKHNSKV